MTTFKKWKVLMFGILLLFVSGCSSDSNTKTTSLPLRDNTPRVLQPEASGIHTVGNDLVTIDISNTSQGYIMVEYLGQNNKVKVQITIPNEESPYTYDKHDGYEVFPLTGGNGTYKIKIFENLSDTKYAQIYSHEFTVQLENEYLPFLYPNQYVNFTADSKVVTKGKDVVENTTTDLEAVQAVYHYIVDTISYDYDTAADIENGDLTQYLPDVDATLQQKKGICFDYAALMATMLRSQNIPTKLQIGYVVSNKNKGIYHAWIGVYIKDIGWIDNLIQFDGKSWKILDPTFASDKESGGPAKEDKYQAKYYY